jgi:hypothetical protein
MGVYPHLAGSWHNVTASAPWRETAWRVCCCCCCWLYVLCFEKQRVVGGCAMLQGAVQLTAAPWQMTAVASMHGQHMRHDVVTHLPAGGCCKATQPPVKWPHSRATVKHGPPSRTPCPTNLLSRASGEAGSRLMSTLLRGGDGTAPESTLWRARPEAAPPLPPSMLVRLWPALLSTLARFCPPLPPSMLVRRWPASMLVRRCCCSPGLMSRLWRTEPPLGAPQ